MLVERARHDGTCIYLFSVSVASINDYHPRNSVVFALSCSLPEEHVADRDLIREYRAWFDEPRHKTGFVSVCSAVKRGTQFCFFLWKSRFAHK